MQSPLAQALVFRAAHVAGSLGKWLINVGRASETHPYSLGSVYRPPIGGHELALVSTGYALANRGMDTRRLQHFLGHAAIGNTVRYTAMSPEPFKDIWR